MSCPHCGDDHGDTAGFCPRTGLPMRDAGVIGRTIGGKYQVLRLLGVGGMGEVYECEHLGMDRRVCLKRLLPEYRRQQAVVARFEREARMAAAVEHENVVAIYDVGMAEDGCPYFIMPCLQGEALARVRQREGRLQPARACRILDQVLAALEVAHARGIVHRDLKPDNVFLVEKESGGELVKLLDFGISKGAGDRAQLTQTGTVVGTPAYMSPEQAHGARDLDHRADLWAAGVMLFEMLSGELPYEAASYQALVVQIATSPPPRAIDRCPALPTGLAAVVDRALMREVERRFQTAREFRGAMTPWLTPGISGITTVPDEVRAAAREPKAPTPATGTAAAMRHPGDHRWMALAAALGLAALGVGGWTLSRAGKRPAPPPPAPVAVASNPPAPAPAAAPTPAPPLPPTPPAAPATIQLTIEAAPRQAALLIDGARLAGNPYTGRFPRDRAGHQLQVQAEGHHTVRRLVTFDADQRVVVDLERSHGSSRPSPSVSAAQPPTPPKVKPAEPVYKGSKGSLITDYPQ